MCPADLPDSSSTLTSLVCQRATVWKKYWDSPDVTPVEHKLIIRSSPMLSQTNSFNNLVYNLFGSTANSSPRGSRKPCSSTEIWGGVYLPSEPHHCYPFPWSLSEFISHVQESHPKSSWNLRSPGEVRSWRQQSRRLTVPLLAPHSVTSAQVLIAAIQPHDALLLVRIWPSKSVTQITSSTPWKIKFSGGKTWNRQILCF